MAIAARYSSFTPVGNTAGTSFALTPPNSSAVAGDVAIVVISERSGTEKVTKIADTAAGTKTFTNYAFYNAGSQTTVGISVWYRVLQTGDPGVGNTNTWTVTQTGSVEAALMVYSGVDTTTPISANDTGTAGVSIASIATKAITLPDDNSWVVVVIGENIATAPYSSSSITTPGTGDAGSAATLTTRANAGNGGGVSSKQGMALLDAAYSNSASQTSDIYTITLASSNNAEQYSFSLKPSVPAVTWWPFLVPDTSWAVVRA